MATYTSITPISYWDSAALHTHLFKTPDALAKIYEFLSLKDARSFSLASPQTRESFISDRVQSALLKINFQNISKFPFSSRELLLRLSINRYPHNTKPFSLTVLLDHRFNIEPMTRMTNMKIYANAEKAVSGLENGTLFIWDLVTGKCIQTFKHKDKNSEPFISLDINDEEKILFSKSYNTIAFWDLTTGKCLMQKDYVRSPRPIISKDLKRVLTVDAYDIFKLWDVTRGECLQTIHARDGIGSLNMSADGTKAFLESYYRGFKLWDLITGRCLQTLPYCNNRKIQVNENGTIGLRIFDETAEFWDLTTRKCLQTLKIFPYVDSLQLSITGERVFWKTGHSIKLWDWANKKSLWTLDRPDTKVINTNEKNKTLILYGSYLLYLDLVTGKILNKITLPCDTTLIKVFGEKIIHIADHHSITVYDLTSGKLLFTLHLPLWIVDVELSKDGRTILFTTMNKTLHCLNMIPSLPEELVAQAEQSFLKNPECPFFIDLPSFVQKKITWHSNPSIEKVNQAFTKYMKRHFLPDVKANLEELERQSILDFDYTKSILFKETLRNFDLLSDSIKNDVYKKLYEIKKKANTLPQPVPYNYGNLAFHGNNEYTATIQEKIQAVTLVLDSKSKEDKCIIS